MRQHAWDQSYSFLLALLRDRFRLLAGIILLFMSFFDIKNYQQLCCVYQD